MKTENRNKTLLLTLCLLSTLIYVLGSCSDDNDLTGSSDLSISMQIPTTRSADPEAPQSWKSENEVNRTTPVYEDECGLFALTEVKKRDSNAFTKEYDDKTASDYYNSLKKCAADSCGYKGGAMPASTILTVGQRYGLLTGMEMFDEKTSPEDYFSKGKNAQNAKIACFQKYGKDHYAKIDYVNTKKGTIKYTDSEGEGQTMDIDNLDGIMYYDRKK